ncbi:arginase family protein [Plebeiibacterium marinum]|uniref:Arginase family protein n=1 Tax=Plebeiibacterium marinum TaxID=2992111 RepID=A0AAE3SLR6_9BACT|nr:arginase family protein [Plebeiobacterium marinum]MCW3806770.1 arginase family protein [Plebeiobacterium marinum]
MNISDFFEIVSKQNKSLGLMPEEDELSNQITYGFCSCIDEEISQYDVAIIGIADGVNAVGNEGVDKAVSEIRKHLACLRKTSRELRVIDLGNIKGKTLNDRFFALREVSKKLLEYQVVGLVLGGGQDYILPIAQSNVELADEVALSLVDSRLDFAVSESDYSSKSVLSQLKSNIGKSIFELNVIGVQKYLVGTSQEDQMNELYWDMVRLGEVRNDNIQQVEPLLRDADLVGFDVGAIQESYMPYYSNINVNGFTGYEACQIAWYAGMSDNLKFFCLQEFNPDFDDKEKGAGLSAQIVWHLLEGISQKIIDVPNIDSESYKIFIVHLHNFSEDIRFYTNRVNDRWWIEVPWKEDVRVLACSKLDYELTQGGNMPDKWWRFFQKGLQI